jgi:hypothetical protein
MSQGDHGSRPIDSLQWLRSRPASCGRAAGEVSGQFHLEIWEVVRDHADIETRKDCLFGLTVEQKAEGSLDALVGPARAIGEPTMIRFRHGDLMVRFIAGFSDNDIKCEGGRMAGLPYLDHRLRSE